VNSKHHKTEFERDKNHENFSAVTNFFGFSDTFAKSNNASEALVIRKGENI